MLERSVLKRPSHIFALLACSTSTLRVRDERTLMPPGEMRRRKRHMSLNRTRIWHPCSATSAVGCCMASTSRWIIRATCRARSGIYLSATFRISLYSIEKSVDWHFELRIEIYTSPIYAWWLKRLILKHVRKGLCSKERCTVGDRLSTTSCYIENIEEK